MNIKKILYLILMYTLCIHAEYSLSGGYDIESTTIPKPIEELKFEIAAGITTFGTDFKGVGYKMKPEIHPLVRLSAIKKISDNNEVGICLIDQWEGRAKTTYVAGVSSNIHHSIAKFNTVSILVTKRFLANTDNEFTPYISASVGISINSLKEVHTGDSAQSIYQRKTSLQPAFGAGVGLRYELNKDADIFVEYQYLDSGKLKTRSVVHTNGTLTSGQMKHKLRQNLIFIGTEFRF